MKNNPFNIRYNSRNHWKGQIEPINGFCSFEHVDYSIRAAYIILRNYIRKGFSTLQQIISRYAPPEENPTAHYINFVVDTVRKYYPKFSCREVLCTRDHHIIVEILYAMMLFEGREQSKTISRHYIYKTLNNFHWS